eukprot:3207777-Pyramimonas_sp.AAC.2
MARMCREKRPSRTHNTTTCDTKDGARLKREHPWRLRAALRPRMTMGQGMSTTCVEGARDVYYLRRRCKRCLLPA